MSRSSTPNGDRTRANLRHIAEQQLGDAVDPNAGFTLSGTAKEILLADIAVSLASIADVLLGHWDVRS